MVLVLVVEIKKPLLYLYPSKLFYLVSQTLQTLEKIKNILY